MDDFSKRMATLYEAMQAEYDKLAKHYAGFTCMGCTDNCCTQRFFHHTMAEYRYLKEGMLKALETDPELARAIIKKSREVTEAYNKERETGEILPLMCPVNFDGLCRLYEHRPMICRLHGMPHRFRRPDGKEERGSGCAPFGEAHKTDWTLNRTALYRELAAIESAVRDEARISGKYSRTTAEMIMDMLDDEPALRGLLNS